MLRLPGKGGPGINGGPNGDVFITIRVGNHSVFERKGDDLYCTVSVSLFTAVLGGKVSVKTFRGRINLDIPPGTGTNRTLRLTGMGMPVYGHKPSFGDCYVKPEIEIPATLSEEELILFKRLQALRQQ